MEALKSISLKQSSNMTQCIITEQNGISQNSLSKYYYLLILTANSHTSVLIT